MSTAVGALCMSPDERPTNSITLEASLPPISSAITLDGNGDGAIVKLAVDRRFMREVGILHGWADRILRITVSIDHEDEQPI